MTLPSFDICLIDTSVIGHLAYHSYYCETDLSTYINNLVSTYEAIPFIHNVKEVLWCGDSPPYWRKLNNGFYKGNRPAKTDDLVSALTALYDKTQPLKFPHFEADDVIATYCDIFRNKKILILTIDSDLLQLLEIDKKNQDRVSWMCAKGYPPQFRSIATGGYQQWLTKKLSKCSKKRIGHLDLNSPQSIIDWKVIYGDPADSIPAGENYRHLVDLRNPDPNWVLKDVHPEFKKLAVQKTKKVKRKYSVKEVLEAYHQNTGSYFPTPGLWARKN